MPQLISNQPVELVFHTLRGGIDPGDHLLFVPGSSKLYMYGRISDPGIGTYPFRGALALCTILNQSVIGQWGWGFPTTWGGGDPAGHLFRPQDVAVEKVWKDF